MPEISHRLPRRTWVRRVLPAGAVAVIVVAGTVVTRVNANASPIDTYRTTTVTTGSVEQRLNLTGSVQRVNQVTQSFAAAGTVSGVSVSVGDTVTAGQVLATLDPAPLRSALTSAKASLAKAQATLESDQSTTATATASTGATGTTTDTSGTSGSAATPVSTPVATATTTTTARGASPSRGSGSGTGLAQAQRRMTSAQRAITDDLRRASAALARCVPFFPSSSSAPSPTTSSPSATTTPTPMPTGGPTPTSTSTPNAATTTTASTSTPSDAEIKACVGALRTAPTQQQIQRHQQALTDSQAALMTTVTLAITTATNTANTPGATSPSTTTGQSSTSPASGSSASASSGSQSSGSQSGTSQSSGGLSSGTGQSSTSRAVTDQAAVTNAKAALSRAQADLASATLKSSIGGTVGSVSLVNGATSQGRSVVIVGAGAVEVTVEVPLASIGTVRVGQKANVTPQGATSAAPGSVTSISLLPSTSTTNTGSGTGQGTTTTSSPTYPVVVLVPDTLPALASGSRADVSLLIGTVSKVLTVPNSALTPLAKGQAMALTLKNGVATRALVRTGYAGMLTTQVTSGLRAGQQVVLADLSTALPTNTTSSRRLGVGGAASGLGGTGLSGSSFGGGTMTGGTGFSPRG